jgi:hypothetical protein
MFSLMPYQWKYALEQVTLLRTQIDPNKPFQATVYVRKNLGICLIYTVLPIKNVRLFQKIEVDISWVIEKIPWNHSEKIRKYLHLNDNASELSHNIPNHYKVYKLHSVF